jgi:energy-coupling factor transporter transmembrane protein EcfT
VPLVATMIRRSTEVSDAVIARGFRLDGVAPSEYHEAQPLRTSDWLVLAVQGLLLAAVFCPSANLTHWVGLR